MPPPAHALPRIRIHLCPQIEERWASHLDQPPEPELLTGFHQPGEGRGVAVPVTVQVVIEVRVRIEQQNVHRPGVRANIAPERGDGGAGD